MREQKKFLIGEDEFGLDYYIDIGKSSHCLISGKTGCAKWNYLQHLFIPAVQNDFSPSQVKIVIIDTMWHELWQNETSKHLYTGIIKEFDQALTLLEELAKEVEHRHGLFLATKNKEITNVKKYNDFVNHDDEKLCNIVVIIDEIFGFMNCPNLKKTFLKALQKATQNAIEVGVYFIITTQRMLKKVITPEIKSIFTTKIVFTTHDKKESINAIGYKGAENLKFNELLYVGNDIHEKKLNCKPVKLKLKGDW